MDKAIRILMVEDNPADAEIIQFELKESGIIFTAKVVMTERDFIRELHEFSPDIILSDYDLPRYTGALALAEARKQCPDVPFILVTGAVSEERAIEILTSGAKDYVMKGRLSRLAPAVRRALTEAEEHKARKEAERELREAHRDLETKVRERTAALEAEIARHRKTEEALQESEILYHSMFENMLDGFAYCKMLFDDRGRPVDFAYLAVNHAFGMLTGLENVVGKKVTDIIPGIKTSNPDLFEIYGRVAMTGRPERFEIYFSPLSKWLYVSAYQTKAEHFVAIFEDVTERMQAKEALSKSESRYRVLFESIQEGFYIADIILGQDGKPDDYVYLDVNPAFEKIMGLAREQIVGKRLKELTPNVSEQWLATFRSVALTGSPVSSEFYSPSFQRYFKAIAYRPFEGQFAVLVEDITERKQAEEAVLHAKQEWERTFDAVPDLIAILDCHHTILRTNRMMAERLSLTPAQCVGKTCYKVVHGTDSPPAFCPHALTLADDEEHVAEVHEKCLGGDFLVSTTPIFDGLGRNIGSVHVARDINKRKKIEETLQERTCQLEEANRELESFSYSVSHDLRAPLRAIDGYLRMILRREGDKFNEETRRQFDQVRDSARTMGKLIEDLLAFSRFGRAALSRTNVDMEALVKLVWEELREGSSDRSMNMEIEHLLPAMVDRSLVKQVFNNLLSNAIKFTKNCDTARIRVGSFQEDHECVYYVKDNGVGFDMKYCDKLFGVFQRLHSASEYEGTGIGLALVQRIIQKHGGRIWAQGSVGEGAEFYFTLRGKE
jgi:PAS domain S-box-containing protein